MRMSTSPPNLLLLLLLLLPEASALPNAFPDNRMKLPANCGLNTLWGKAPAHGFQYPLPCTSRTSPRWRKHKSLINFLALSNSSPPEAGIRMCQPSSRHATSRGSCGSSTSMDSGKPFWSRLRALLANVAKPSGSSKSALGHASHPSISSANSQAIRRNWRGSVCEYRALSWGVPVHTLRLA